MRINAALTPLPLREALQALYYFDLIDDIEMIKSRPLHLHLH